MKKIKRYIRRFLVFLLNKIDMSIPSRPYTKGEIIRQYLLSIFNTQTGIFTRTVVIVDCTVLTKIVFELTFKEGVITFSFENINGNLQTEFMSTTIKSYERLTEISNHLFQKLHPYYTTLILRNLI